MDNVKVVRHFTLVGRSQAFTRGLPKHIADEIKNSDMLNSVKGQVIEQFGDRALLIVDEDRLNMNIGPYPEFYSAGWFVDTDGKNELTVLAHGRSMEAATSLVTDTVSSSWNSKSKSISLGI